MTTNKTNQSSLIMVIEITLFSL